MGDKYSPFLHDAVLLYAIALNETITKGQSLDDGMAIVRNTKGKAFKGKKSTLLGLLGGI